MQVNARKDTLDELRRGIYLLKIVLCGEDYVVLELIKLYNLAKHGKPFLQTILNYSILPRAA